MQGSANVASRVNSYTKNFLEANGLKQCFLAERMGYKPKKFSQLINGRAPMSIDDLTNFCQYFKVPVSEFVPINLEDGNQQNAR